MKFLVSMKPFMPNGLVGLNVKVSVKNIEKDLVLQFVSMFLTQIANIGLLGKQWFAMNTQIAELVNIRKLII